MTFADACLINAQGLQHGHVQIFSRIVDVAPDHIPQLVIIDPAEPLDLFHRHAL